MGSYDLKRLEVAVQYIRRMAEGRNPVTNRPAPDNDVLTNINVNRCLKFVEEILTDVHKAGGQVGALPRKSAPRPSLAETFPYEILSEFHYEQDQQISYLLNQIGRPLPEDQKMPVAATVITNWMRENGYLEKRMMQDIGKENSVPTEKGMQLGLYSEKAGMGQNMYYRVYYNEKALPGTLAEDDDWQIYSDSVDKTKVKWNIENSYKAYKNSKPLGSKYNYMSLRNSKNGKFICKRICKSL